MIINKYNNELRRVLFIELYKVFIPINKYKYVFIIVNNYKIIS